MPLLPLTSTRFPIAFRRGGAPAAAPATASSDTAPRAAGDLQLARVHYQRQVQGLRAVAILSVLLFHVGFAGFGGGYLGVDVFFVISGYLITRMIATEIQATGRLDVRTFYVRRARRLGPALIATLAATAAFAPLMLSPTDLARFGRSLTSALFSVSNVTFWRESGYFDVDATLKPLLHTWSLGVEEQFYLLWPLVIVVAMRHRRAAPWVIGVAGLGSLMLAVTLLHVDVPQVGDSASAVFYLMPFRVVEFAIGAALVWIIPHVRCSRGMGEALMAIGLLAICVVVTVGGAGGMSLWTALIACVGTALAIVAIPASRIGDAVLGNRAAVGLGAISYSVYLVHWPVVVFMRYGTLDPLSGPQIVAALCVSIALGTALYLLVEKRFRAGRSPQRAPQRLALALGTTGAVVAAGLSMAMSGGWGWRVDATQNLSDAELRAQEAARFCRRPDPAKPADLFTCQDWTGKANDVVLWGDSHALHLVAGVATAYPDANVSVVYADGCVPQSGFKGYTQQLATPAASAACAARNRRTLTYLTETAMRATVIITNAKRGRPEQMAAISDELVARLRHAGRRAVFLGDFIRPGRTLLGCANVPRVVIGAEAIARRCAPDRVAIADDLRYNARLAAASRTLIDPTPVQCQATGCQFSDPTGPLFRDSHHLSWRGAAFFVPKLKAQLDDAATGGRGPLLAALPARSGHPATLR